MVYFKRHFLVQIFSVIMVAIAVVLPISAGIAAGAEGDFAFAEKAMIRLSSNNVSSGSTDITVLSKAGVGTGVSFDDDLGGESSVRVPGIEGYYRFSDRHRISFGSVRFTRNGIRTLDVDLQLGEETFSIGETIESRLDYSVLRLGYTYSFYRSAEAEMGLSAGLSLTDYEFDYQLSDGSRFDGNGVSAPLPMFGLRMAYEITRHWSARYTFETLFIELGDELQGTLLNFELDLEYRFENSFAVGAGISRSSTDFKVRDADWRGRVDDSYRGLLLYGSYYFQ